MTRGAPTGLFAEVLPPVAKKARLPRMHMNGIDGDAAKPQQVAGAEEDLRKKLDDLWKMGIPAGVAGNDVYKKRQKDIALTERQLKAMGLAPYND